jgi:adenosylcobyric acid synthase
MKGNVMFQAVSSSAGKSTVVASLCRHYNRLGENVAPFKAQNLSLNSYVTRDGGEIGISQAYQAWACGLEPSTDMNPILLKPKGEMGMQLILNGRPYQDVDADHHISREHLLEQIEAAYFHMKERFELVIIEGSGSPSEINLRDRDVANMATAEIAQAPVVLIGDIEKGGVFAGLYGTYRLLEERHRPLVRGFIINKFRGEASILDPGIKRLEREMKCPCLGILPYQRLHAPAEDSMEIGRVVHLSEGEDVRQAWLDSLDQFTDSLESCLDLNTLDQIIKEGI